MRPHVSAETMARYRQGDLNQRRTSHISTHLAGCDRCSALSRDLGGVTRLLASASPPPMPDDLTARITRAIAAESARRPAEAQTAQAPAAPRRHTPRRSRLPHVTPRLALGGLAAAAALVVVAGGLYKVVGSSSSSAGSASASAPSAAHSGPAPAANEPMVPAPTSGPALQYEHGGREKNITPISTGTNFTPAGLTSQITAEVRKYGAEFTKTGSNAGVLGGSGTASPAAVPREQTGTFATIPLAALQGCVNRIAAGSLVLLVDVARYHGALATVIVTEAGESGSMQIWVVGTGCSASRSDVLQHATAATP